MEARDCATSGKQPRGFASCSGFPPQKHKSDNTKAPKLQQTFSFTPLFRPNEGVKSTVRVKRSPATTMHGLTSAPQTAAAQPLHLFPKHHACLWGCGKFQKKSKIRPSLPLSRVPETPAEFHKFRRLLASLCKPESKFLVAEPSFDTSR